MSVMEQVNSMLLHVDSVGQGEDVILLHGWGMHSAYWQPLIESLQSQFRVHCIDLPGHGSSCYRGELTEEAFVERIKLTIDSITVQPFILIGWSLGGLLAQQFVRQWPDRIKRLVLVSSSASFVQRDNWPHAMSENTLNSFASFLLQDYKTTLNRFLALQVYGSENQKQELRELKEKLYSRGEPVADALQVGLGLLQSMDLRKSLNAIRVPVMLLGGERDTLVPQQALSEMNNQLATSTLHIVKGAGHAPFMSHPDEVNRLCQEFLSHE